MLLVAVRSSQLQANTLIELLTCCILAEKTFWAVVFSPDGAFLAATGIDGNVTVWDVRGDDPVACGYLETKGTPGLCIDYV